MPIEKFDPQNVLEPWIIYDTVLIGTSVDPKYPGGVANFTELAQKDHLAYLNARNTAEAGGKFYTNISSKDKLPWPFWLESIGMRFMLPSPNTNSGEEHTALMAAEKVFADILPEHCVFEFAVREDTILIEKPAFLPSGFGPTGFMQMQNASPGLSASLITNGDPNSNNRFKFVGDAVGLPRDTPISGKLTFSDHGKTLLEALATVPSLDFIDEVAGVAMIELTLRGMREVQQRGEWHWGAGR